ncbi:MAG TPA: right-handed parallel beta-helix repeat-containing protein [Candidatus Krumholzibacteria bacterium]|nr:right-handed parallel beta-helix repeat-containing protein [Candidatus Krumholzibacteria bacterium]
MNIRWITCALGGLVVACSGGTTSVETPVNRAPTIEFTYTKLAAVKNTNTDLSVAVTDADGDPLTVSWTPTRGTLTAQNPQKTVMRWAVPATVGTDSVTVTVSDGKVTRKITEVIRVGTQVTTTRALFDKAGSPYIVVLDAGNPVFGIDAGNTTEFDPGVDFYMDTPGSVIDVGGRLLAHGLADQPVVFRPNRRLQCGDDRGWWVGIHGFTQAGDSVSGEIVLDHTEIRHAQYGVRASNASTAILRDCAVRCSSDAGVYHDGIGRMELRDTEVSNGLVHGILIGGNVSTAIPDSILIDGCMVAFNEASGIYMNLNDQVQEVGIVVQRTAIEYNFVHGITLGRAVFPVIHRNRFRSNGVGSGTVSNIYLETGYPNGVTYPTLDATCNYWGAVVGSRSTIDLTIRDSLDAASVGTRVNVEPWLDQDPLTVTGLICP